MNTKNAFGQFTYTMRCLFDFKLKFIYLTCLTMKVLNENSASENACEICQKKFLDLCNRIFVLKQFISLQEHFMQCYNVPARTVSSPWEAVGDQPVYVWDTLKQLLLKVPAVSGYTESRRRNAKSVPRTPTHVVLNGTSRSYRVAHCFTLVFCLLVRVSIIRQYWTLAITLTDPPDALSSHFRCFRRQLQR